MRPSSVPAVRTRGALAATRRFALYSMIGDPMRILEARKSRAVENCGALLHALRAFSRHWPMRRTQP